MEKRGFLAGFRRTRRPTACPTRRPTARRVRKLAKTYFWPGVFHANPMVAEDLGPQGAIGAPCGAKGSLGAPRGALGGIFPYSPFGGPALLGKAREDRLHW